MTVSMNIIIINALDTGVLLNLVMLFSILPNEILNLCTNKVIPTKDTNTGTDNITLFQGSCNITLI